jgi:hypothetical protein
MAGPWVANRILFLVAVAVSSPGCAVVTPTDMTRTQMFVSFIRIDEYFKHTAHLPPSLDALPKRSGELSGLRDGWHNPLQYTVSSDGVITLTSYGWDRKPGGSG